MNRCLQKVVNGGHFSHGRVSPFSRTLAARETKLIRLKSFALEDSIKVVFMVSNRVSNGLDSPSLTLSEVVNLPHRRRDRWPRRSEGSGEFDLTHACVKARVSDPGFWLASVSRVCVQTRE
ncbi:hypothetical protein Salat_0223100 [Sesamum alatum]|uniref:Uncharacterized protein n=1 Tax=Sesamum alatum TaxID=300844 RepID=A0AAE1YY57_9LAMI|nr:hypothetical protein Salat_0223100 [Sesamum alatum]